MSETRTVGTSADCDLRIEDAPYMSNRHFSMTRHDDGLVTVQDCGSTNGTEVYTAAGWIKANWQPVPVGPGSKILAGRVLFKFDAAGQVSVHRDVGLFQRDSA